VSRICRSDLSAESFEALPHLFTLIVERSEGSLHLGDL